MNVIYDIGCIVLYFPFLFLLRHILDKSRSIHIHLIAIGFTLIWPLIMGMLFLLFVIRYRRTIFQ